ncbi:MAG TPA: hypothetical protein VHH73_07070 [Verrucomicrobiae bacterium]|nr:hypothetical protein [Verrucomicrobiae bacterium]
MKSTATANPILTQLAVKCMQDPAGFVGLQLFPLFLTAEQSASYFVMNEENFLNIPRNIQRGPGGSYSRSLMKISDDSYNCREFGHEEPVDDRERKKYANSFDADQAAVNRLVNIIRFNHEARVRDQATSGAVPTSSPSTKWDAGGSTPIADVETAKSAIRKGCGLPANVMIVNIDVFNVLKEHTTIVGKIQYAERAIVTPQILAAIFGVDKFLVAGAVENTANEGQALSPSYLWSDSVVLAHAETAQDLMAPNFGRTFAWIGETGPDGVLVETYRQDQIRSDVHRGRQDVDEKIIGAKCGYHLSNVLAA